MKQKTFGMVGLSIYATAWITKSATSVGTPSTCEPISIGVPFLMAAIILLSAFFGYLIGSDKE